MYSQLIVLIQPFAIALALGLLIGIERERSHPPGFQPLGLRSFVLLSLLGTLAAKVAEPLVAVAITAFVGAAVIAGYIRSSTRKREQPDVGITTEIAGVVTYALGYIAYQDAFLALLIGIVVLIVLMARTQLHQFSRQKIQTQEFRAAVILLIIAIGIIPFLPDKTIDPLNLFNPQRFMFIVFFIALIQFGAYVGIRMFGKSRGVLLTGFLSGFVSSTITSFNFGTLVKQKKIFPLTAAIGLGLATAAMFIETFAIVYVLTPFLSAYIALLVLPAALVTIGVAAFVANSLRETEFIYEQENPLSMMAAFRLAIVLFITLIAATLVQRFIGNDALNIFAFLSGFIQTRGVILAVANLFLHGHISLEIAISSLALTLLASFFSKFFIFPFAKNKEFMLWASAIQTGILIIFLLSWFAVSYFF